jgi:uncharacterized protein YcfL
MHCQAFCPAPIKPPLKRNKQWRPCLSLFLLLSISTVIYICNSNSNNNNNIISSYSSKRACSNGSVSIVRISTSDNPITDISLQRQQTQQLKSEQQQQQQLQLRRHR